jgi:hypothetical protein
VSVGRSAKLESGYRQRSKGNAQSPTLVSRRLNPNGNMTASAVAAARDPRQAPGGNLMAAYLVPVYVFGTSLYNSLSKAFKAEG